MALISTLVQSLQEVDGQEDILACLQILLTKLNPNNEAGDCLLSACVALEEDIKQTEDKLAADLLTPPDNNWKRWQDEAVAARGGL